MKKENSDEFYTAKGITISRNSETPLAQLNFLLRLNRISTELLRLGHYEYQAELNTPSSEHCRALKFSQNWSPPHFFQPRKSRQLARSAIKEIIVEQDACRREARWDFEISRLQSRGSSEGFKLPGNICQDPLYFIRRRTLHTRDAGKKNAGEEQQTISLRHWNSVEAATEPADDRPAG
uniref:Uncharacterized protein n=1 Tax=Vespula pensylvanica TaxID=30213 RepID=A0A834P3D8_VESPE|nr:hypothetical protein H0235_006593 [Vespula pensylvanica]